MSVKTNSLIYNSTLQVESNLDSITTVVQWFNQFNCSPLPYQIWIEGQTGLIEGFTNVVRHAHRHLSPATPVDLAVEISAEYFQIRVWDQGAPFNLEALLEKLSKHTSEHGFNPLNREAHWGCIFLLKLRKKYKWTISYTRDSRDINCLLLKKTLEK